MSQYLAASDLGMIMHMWWTPLPFFLFVGAVSHTHPTTHSFAGSKRHTDKSSAQWGSGRKRKKDRHAHSNDAHSNDTHTAKTRLCY